MQAKWTKYHNVRGFGPPQLFTKCNYQTCFISKGQKVQSFQFKTVLEAMFHKIMTNYSNIFRLLAVFYLLRTPSQIQHASPLPVIPLVTGTYTGRKKGNTDFRYADHLWMKRGEGGDPASPIISETALNNQMERGGKRKTVSVIRWRTDGSLTVRLDRLM